MFNLKRKTAKDRDVFISFETPWVSADAHSIRAIDSVMRSYFGDSTSCISGGDEESSEMVYKVQKPVLSTSDSMESFFKKLQTVFSLTSEFSPHFTHDFLKENQNR